MWLTKLDESFAIQLDAQAIGSAAFIFHCVEDKINIEAWKLARASQYLANNVTNECSF